MYLGALLFFYSQIMQTKFDKCDINVINGNENEIDSYLIDI